MMSVQPDNPISTNSFLKKKICSYSALSCDLEQAAKAKRVTSAAKVCKFVVDLFKRPHYIIESYIGKPILIYI